MWCLINLPNGTTSAVQCDPKKNSQECLEKVCSDLGIICETDYFGLIPVRDGESAEVDECSAKQWINLRNPLSLHANDRNHPILLSLRVKFWVPAHLILQDSVRRLFYMQARQELLDGHLSASGWANAAHLAALLLQADGYNYDPSKVLANLVEPTEGNQTAATLDRRQLRRPSKRKCSESEGKRERDGMASPANSDDESTDIKPKNIYQSYIVKPRFDETEPEAMPENLIQMIANEHEMLARIKMTPTSAQYWLLEEISSLNGYGEEVFEGVTINEPSVRCKIGVSPHGLMITKEEQKFNVPFTAVKAAKSIKRSFRLTYMNEEHGEANAELKLPSHRTAACLYRAITEKHVFYSCETVRPIVTTQFIRDLKGTIVSMFNEDTELGKRYVFDIQRTCREVYDNSRRILHARGIEISKVQQECPQTQLGNLDQHLAENAEEANKLERLVEERIVEAVTCIICADNMMDTMFLPCGHIAACRKCADQCDRCPLCRANIECVNKAFLPPVLRTRSRTASAVATASTSAISA
ncbi:E3 ubiquitin-protein ligase MYLIP [Toxorhynchites rutilus septentrionalis]|uniref:E3 ubiquitin-protein ligase MYLIP n=1 Tax=Toxorhynchites rutilus septentrionalis TaxID=329112 RepID=UPI00247A9DF1|nr:E3 ubiquitin-protein ligase MYLIP [Toxorhynchites rutilus septentrionalis]